MVFMPHWPIPLWKESKYDLETIKQLLEALGNPHLRIPPVIHIAGTNGKGSVQAFLKSIFEKSGYKVHSYTSPHLIEFNERIVLASEQITDDYLFQICERVRIVAEKNNIEPRFFEGVTAAALLAFSEVQADIVILETGMGGRLDATNIIPSPALTIITPILLDHMEALGPTPEIIAGEKAGIIKPGVPCVISCQMDEVYEVLFTRCEQMRAPSLAFSYDFGVEKVGQDFKILGVGSDDASFPLPNLLGDHQIINAATAIVAVKQLENFAISQDNIESGITSAIWPGRIEKIGEGLWIDGAHNQSGAIALSHWANENLARPISLILGMTKNRNVEMFLAPFKDVAGHIFCVQVKSEPSSYSAERLAELAAPIGIPLAICSSLEEAILLAKQREGDVIITGSLFLVGDLRGVRHNASPSPARNNAP